MKPTLTGRERVRAVLTGKIPDRVAFHPSIFFDFACRATGHRFEDWLLDPLVGPERMLAAAVRFRTDTVRFMMVPDDEWFQTKVVREEAGAVIQYDRKTDRREGAYDVAGGGKLTLFDPPPPIRTRREVDAIPVIPARDYAQRGHLRSVTPAIQKAHELGLAVCGFCTGQTLNFMVDKMGGTETALLCFHDEPSLARALIDKACEISIEKARAWVAAGVDIVYIGDSYASASVISPALYREFCAPAYRQVTTAIHEAGAFVYKHCCGSYDPLLDDLPSTGIDAMDGIDPTRGMSVAHTKAAIGRTMTLMGGMSCLTLLNGTPEQVYQEAVRCIQDGKPGGRYALGTACATPPGTPPDNLEAMYKALEDHGYY